MPRRSRVHGLPAHAVLIPGCSDRFPRHATQPRDRNSYPSANGNLIIGGGWPASFDEQRGRSHTRRDSIAGNLWVAQRVYPAIGQLDLIRSCGAVGVMIDGALIVGELPDYPGFYNVVGANGYTMAPALGMLIAEQIMSGDASMPLAPFGLARFAPANA